MTLMLHCGAHKTSFDEVCNVVPDRSLTSASFRPVPHSWLFNRTVETLDDLGFSVVEEAHALMRNGQRYFGYLKIRKRVPGQDVRDLTPEYDFICGVRNGHDGQMKAAWVFGEQVFVCDNLAFSGDMIEFSRKHTRNIVRDVQPLMFDKLSSIECHMQNVHERVEHYKNTPVKTRRDLNDLVITALRDGAVRATSIEHVLREWDKSQEGSGPGGHESLGGNSYWTLFNCFTEVEKQRPSIVEQPKRNKRLTSLLDATSRFVPYAVYN